MNLNPAHGGGERRPHPLWVAEGFRVWPRREGRT